MQIFKSKLFRFGVAVAAVAMLAATTPRAAHAVAAALVQTTNTTANPVQGADVEKLARIPYQSHLTKTGCSGSSFCLFSYFTQPPTGYRLVVENISALLANAAGTTVPPLGSLNASNIEIGFSANNLGGKDFAGNVYAALNVSTKIYFDPSDGPIYASILGDWPSGVQQTMTVTGYLENCSITGCPAVQQ
jgi:hypothetical protein